MTQPASQQLFRALPSMDSVLFALEQAEPSLAALPRPLVRDCVENFLGVCRDDIRAGRVHEAESLALPLLLPRIVSHVQRTSRPHFRRALNATGVVIHTNLGRSLLAPEAAEAARQAALCYSNLEFDLETGQRGSRYSHVEPLICKLTGAEAALVVNNNAAAVLLLLDTLCKGHEVVVSRGQLVEIGGSFRIPEVMEKSGCILKEVGATNRVHPKDYQAVLNEQTAALLKVHTSNFRIRGFTCEVTREELARIAHTHGLPLLEDLGSGNLIDFSQVRPQAGLNVVASLFGEPTAAAALAGGADVVTFSGDKILGGPQAGIIAGKAEYIERIKKNPMNRALRIDKMTLAALETTLRLYLDPERALARIPTLRMLCMTERELLLKARKLARTLKAHLAREHSAHAGAYRITVSPGTSMAGGGAFPDCALPTHLVCVRLTAAPLSPAPSPAGSASAASETSHMAKKNTAPSGPPRPDQLRERLLHTDPPLVARVENDALCLDPRTLDDAEFSTAAHAFALALQNAHRA